MSDPLDALIIGAGPAGLTAAIYLARFKRCFRVIHNHDSRAQWIPLSHNHPGFPAGIGGPDLLDRMRRQAEVFGARIDRGLVTALTRDGAGFTLTVDGEPLSAMNVLVATGVADHAPPIPNVEDAIRRGLVRVCPICDGYEMSGRSVGVIGDDGRAVAEALFLKTYTEALSVIHIGPAEALTAEDRDHLRAAGINLIEATIREARLDGDRIGALRFDDGACVAFDALYAALGVSPRADLAIQAGAATAEDGRLVVDDHQQTTVPGLFAAGDLVRGLNQISTAEGEAAIAATSIHNRLRERS
jgi:thioredoxin reductase (NADPH)